MYALPQGLVPPPARVAPASGALGGTLHSSERPPSPSSPTCRRQRGRSGTHTGPKDGGGGASLLVVASVRGGGAA
jgi:hypothetical protein